MSNENEVFGIIGKQLGHSLVKELGLSAADGNGNMVRIREGLCHDKEIHCAIEF